MLFLPLLTKQSNFVSATISNISEINLNGISFAMQNWFSVDENSISAS